MDSEKPNMLVFGALVIIGSIWLICTGHWVIALAILLVCSCGMDDGPQDYDASP